MTSRFRHIDARLKCRASAVCRRQRYTLTFSRNLTCPGGAPGTRRATPSRGTLPTRRNRRQRRTCSMFRRHKSSSDWGFSSRCENGLPGFPRHAVLPDDFPNGSHGKDTRNEGLPLRLRGTNTLDFTTCDDRMCHAPGWRRIGRLPGRRPQKLRDSARGRTSAGRRESRRHQAPVPAVTRSCARRPSPDRGRW